MNNQFKHLLTLKQQYEAELTKFGAGAFFQMYKEELFNVYPEVRAVRWTQYTPYFNDGDPCVFNVHDISLLIDGLESQFKGDDEGFVYHYYCNEEHSEIVKTALQLHGSVPSDVFLHVFGDHVEITIYRDSPSPNVKECQHD